MSELIFWEFQARLARRLMAWGVASIAAGAVFILYKDKFWRGLGQQFFLWGLIDALIAWFGGRGSQQRLAKFSADPAGLLAATQAGKDARRLQNLLAINTALDVLYVFGGAAVLRRRGAVDRYWRGAGLGIIIQGAFLYLFDLIHALLIARQFNRPR